MELKTIHVGHDGRTVHYYRAGQGKPLLYLHHLLGIRGFEPALAQLAEHYDLIAPFAPGWGPAKDDLTDFDPGALDLTLHHCDLLDALGVAQADVVGISIGAWMAAELAAIQPQRVAQLVLNLPERERRRAAAQPVMLDQHLGIQDRGGAAACSDVAHHRPLSVMRVVRGRPAQRPSWSTSTTSMPRG